MEKVNNKTVKVMSYNLRRSNVFLWEITQKNPWQKRREGLAAQIAGYNPDLLGMQEVSSAQLKYLSKKLPCYAYVSLGRDKYGKGEACSVFFKKDRYELLSHETFWLSKTPDKPSKYLDTNCKRICTYVKLKDKIDSKCYCLFNTHLDNQSEKAREFGAKMILEKLSSFDCPVILTGDFNDTEQSGAYKILLKELRDVAKVAESAVEQGTFHDFTGEPEPYPIDFIFVTEGFFVKKYAVLSENKEKFYPSDHFPIIAELTCLI